MDAKTRYPFSQGYQFLRYTENICCEPWYEWCQLEERFAHDIPHAFLHNAGNDAYYTLVLALRLCDPQSRALSTLDKPHPILPKKKLRPNCSEGEFVDSAEALISRLYVQEYKSDELYDSDDEDVSL